MLSYLGEGENKQKGEESENGGLQLFLDTVAGMTDFSGKISRKWNFP